ncbi:MAG: M1 family peptidase [Chitinophagaceae bacterium]|nr:M1 family peptidase [Chitinophagaceae bacterium]MCA6491833.1 M1 family peptidase [Chitinophagaceae bacterium]MCA6512804.1 M1 family peptidase [Chitinophagaceae bacterium]
MKKFLLLATLFLAQQSFAQYLYYNPGSNHGNKFEQLGTMLPTPNEYRTASGAPGPKYWQQRADYKIKCTLDEPNFTLRGSETITYYNNSPDVLTYLWLQLDENEHSSVNNANYQNSTSLNRVYTTGQLDQMTTAGQDNGNGDRIQKITDANGKPLSYRINKTMMRVNLPAPLKPGQQFVFSIDWTYKITNRYQFFGRGGYEIFSEDSNALFTITQWFPRLCVYSDFQGWQNHQFAGTGEFALIFGNYDVQITAPADHVVMATGECKNYPQILNPTQLARWQKAQTVTEPIEIVTLDEATKAEKQRSKATKTWIFTANNVRDFAWGSSRKFVWDAMPAYVEGKKVMCMSAYPKEAYNLWRRYSTKLVAHTIKTYSKFSIPYPYPTAQSIEASNGMEYPMICFNNGRTEKDGTYSESTKNGMVGVIIHEVGHNFFPMIVNSDERQWTWMDEGLNSFVEYLTEELYDNKFPSRRGPAFAIADYMRLPKDQLEPIMTNSENIISLGSNAYAKPSAGLNILRETIMGRELFDEAFKEYARRWAFKHPTPADLFRTMEDASGEDLDWFWRGWFYTIDPCDISLDSVRYAVFDPNMAMPAGGMGGRGMGGANGRPVAKPLVNSFEDISKIRNRNDKNILFLTDVDTTLRDFYWRYARGLEPYDSVTRIPMPAPATPEPLTEEEKAKYGGMHLYEINCSNKGGLIMPVIVEFTFEDGTTMRENIPAQIWRKNEKSMSKVYMTKKKAVKIQIDPMRETADINESNNTWPKVGEASKFAIFKGRIPGGRGGIPQTGNPMQVSQQKK